jgi:hypothetical protein
MLKSITPQSLAIHESVADLTALRCSFRCRELTALVLQQVNGSLDCSTAFSGLAEQFARRNRKLLGIHPDVTFEVRPRLDVTKLYWHRTGKSEVRECLFKVAWTQVESNPVGSGLPRTRRYGAGSTLAITWDDKPRVRAVISTTRTTAERQTTNDLLRRLLTADRLRVGNTALGPGDRPLRGVIEADINAGALRLRGAGRMLHVTQEY